MANLQNGDRLRVKSQSNIEDWVAFSDFRTSMDVYYQNVANNNTSTGNNIHSGTETFNGAVTFGASSGQVLVSDTTLTATEIVGNAAGDIGHASGATLIAAPAAGTAILYLGAVLIYDFVVAAYTGGGNDIVICYGAGGATLTGATTSANLLGAAADKMVSVYPLAAAGNPIVSAAGISLKSTAWTQPGTAAGTLRCIVYYRLITGAL